LPRGKGLTLSMGQIVRIVMVAVALVALIALQRPCADNVSKFVTSFGEPDAAVAPLDGATAELPQGEMLRGNMTEAELAAAIARARQNAAPDGGIDAGVDAAANPRADAASTPLPP
jgi:hypothetical protein